MMLPATPLFSLVSNSSLCLCNNHHHHHHHHRAISSDCCCHLLHSATRKLSPTRDGGAGDSEFGLSLAFFSPVKWRSDKVNKTSCYSSDGLSPKLSCEEVFSAGIDFGTLPQNHMGANNVDLLIPSENPKPRITPKRFIKNQIPDSITNDPALNTAISLLPANYNFEVHKCVWRIQTSGAKRVALQFPEGLLMYSLVLSDIFKTFGKLDDCFVLGDVTYGACCIDDFSAIALGADLLIHYGHSCLIPIDSTKIPSLYVFVEIKIDVDRLIDTVRLNIDATESKKLALAGTIQFSTAIRASKSALESAGFEVLIPQSKPLSAGEVLGCTAPTLPKGSVDVLIFVADGRFHLEAFMISNPGIKAFRYDPYLGVLFLEEYDHTGMKQVRKKAILKAREAKSWGIVLGTLGRQGNPKILDRLQGRMRERGFVWTVILMSEISPTRVSLFGESIDAWIQIACPRLSIDWGEAFVKPLLTPFEAEIALEFVPGWWEKSSVSINCENSLTCVKNKSCCRDNGVNMVNSERGTDYPMDYYAQEGGEWNCSYSKKSSHPRRNLRSCTSNVVIS